MEASTSAEGMGQGLLANLPSAGVFVAHDSQASRRRPTTYLCTHDTQPPLDQVISTDNSTAALIRVLKSKKAQDAITGKGKRPSAAADKQAPQKKMAIAPSLAGAGGRTSGAGPSQPAAGPSAAQPPPSSAVRIQQQIFTQEELKAMSNKELQELLKARSLPVSGKKDDLLRRIVEYQRRMKQAAQPS